MSVVRWRGRCPYDVVARVTAVGSAGDSHGTARRNCPRGTTRAERSTSEGSRRITEMTRVSPCARTHCVCLCVRVVCAGSPRRWSGSPSVSQLQQHASHPRLTARRTRTGGIRLDARARAVRPPTREGTVGQTRHDATTRRHDDTTRRDTRRWQDDTRRDEPTGRESTIITLHPFPPPCSLFRPPGPHCPSRLCCPVPRCRRLPLCRRRRRQRRPMPA